MASQEEDLQQVGTSPTLRVSTSAVQPLELTRSLGAIPISFWALVSDALPPQEAKSLAEDLGIEFDTTEHLNLERGPLCAPPSRNSVLGKRRR